MAAGVLPAPGTKNYYGEEIGPCVRNCRHDDCGATKAMARAACGICGQPIGYGVRFYEVPLPEMGPGTKDLVHATCVEAK